MTKKLNIESQILQPEPCILQLNYPKNKYAKITETVTPTKSAKSIEPTVYLVFLIPTEPK